MATFPVLFPNSELTCPVVHTGVSYHLTQLSSALLVLFGQNHVQGFISNISVGSSQAWYFRLTQFEVVMFGLVMLQMVVLRYLEILPININNIFGNDPSGRRKRREIVNDCNENSIANSVIKLLHKLDEDDCLPMSLCELQLQVQSSHWGMHLPKVTKSLLKALNVSGKKRKTTRECDGSSAISIYESAVQIDSENKYANSTHCARRYPGCSLTKEDVIHYVNLFISAELI